MKRKAFFNDSHKFTRRLVETARRVEWTISQGGLEAHLKRLYSEPPCWNGGSARAEEPIATRHRVQYCCAREVPARRLQHSWRRPAPVQHKNQIECLTRFSKPVARFVSYSGKRHDWHGAIRLVLSHFHIKRWMQGLFGGVLVNRMVDVLIANGLVDSSAQKLGVPRIPGCIQHCGIIWNTIQKAPVRKQDLPVILLDLANAQGYEQTVKKMWMIIWHQSKEVGFLGSARSGVCSLVYFNVGLVADHLWSGHHPCGSNGADCQWHMREVARYPSESAAVVLYGHPSNLPLPIVAVTSPEWGTPPQLRWCSGWIVHTVFLAAVECDWPVI